MSGLEWASYQLTINNSPCPSGTVTMPATATSLLEFTVTVTCSGSGPHLLTATAASGTPNGATYVRRIISRTMP